MANTIDANNACLALGPSSLVTTYTSYVVNGRRCRTKDSEKSTQDSGVSIEAETVCIERDGSEVVKKIVYYGVLREIILLNFHKFKVPIFKCDWVGNSKNDIKV